MHLTNAVLLVAVPVFTTTGSTSIFFVGVSGNTYSCGVFSHVGRTFTIVHHVIVHFAVVALRLLITCSCCILMHACGTLTSLLLVIVGPYAVANASIDRLIIP